MSLVADTTSTTITGRDGTADFTITTDGIGGTYELSYKCILDMFRIREVIEMTSADTFCTEGSTDQEPGRSQLQFEIAGVGKKNGPASGPLIPAPQNVPIKATYSAACFIAFNANFTEANADRLVNQNMRIGGRGLSKGSYTVTWDKTP
jgi:hypothetical protein